MKRLIPFLFCVAMAVVYGQEVVENPGTPQNKNARRVLNLEEEFRIDGKGEGYFHNNFVTGYLFTPRISI